MREFICFHCMLLLKTFFVECFLSKGGRLVGCYQIGWSSILLIRKIALGG